MRCALSRSQRTTFRVRRARSFASLVGDAVIDDTFIGGLAAFFVAHVLYLVAMGLPTRTMGTVLSKLPALVLGGAIWWVLVGSGRAPGAFARADHCVRGRHCDHARPLDRTSFR
ncbi:MAG: hypothetical protein IPM54_01190 [Polyangiaceae bacterium]|nr:hypothetical protein [Polyangiaceae bacterium]